MRLILQSGDFSRDVPKVEFSGKYIQRGCQQMFSFTIQSILEGFYGFVMLGCENRKWRQIFCAVVVACGCSFRHLLVPKLHFG